MTAQDRRLAAWAHVMALLHVPGLFVTLAIWLRARERSTWAGEQARRALRFQLGLQAAWTAAALLAAAGFRLVARAGWPAEVAIAWSLLLLTGLLGATLLGAGIAVSRLRRSGTPG